VFRVREFAPFSLESSGHTGFLRKVRRFVSGFDEVTLLPDKGSRPAMTAERQRSRVSVARVGAGWRCAPSMSTMDVCLHPRDLRRELTFPNNAQIVFEP